MRYLTGRQGDQRFFLGTALFASPSPPPFLFFFFGIALFASPSPPPFLRGVRFLDEELFVLALMLRPPL